jgi:hypothetical protein
VVRPLVRPLRGPVSMISQRGMMLSSLFPFPFPPPLFLLNLFICIITDAFTDSFPRRPPRPSSPS